MAKAKPNYAMSIRCYFPGGEQQDATLPENAAGRYSEVGGSVSIHAPERREHHR